MRQNSLVTFVAPDKRVKVIAQKKGAKSDASGKASGATEKSSRSAPAVGKKKAKLEQSEDQGNEKGGSGVVRVMDLPHIMPPPPLLLLHALLPMNETGQHYPFEGWSLQQLHGLSSELDHIRALSSTLHEQVSQELEKLDDDAVEAGCDAWVESVGGGVATTPKPERTHTMHESESEQGGGGGGGGSGGGDRGRREAMNASAQDMGDSFQQEDDYDDYPLEEEEEEYDYQIQKDGAGAGGASSNKRGPSRNSFWGWMDQYFARLGPQHLQLLRQTNIRDDPAFVIPKLGQHYLEKWNEADSTRSNSNAATVANNSNNSNNMDRIGDVTARLLAALVSDQDVKKPKKRDMESKHLKTEDAVAAVAFNKELATQVDDKLRAQLIGMELLPKQGMLPPDAREDDEICAIIRQLQRQLKEQITINNAMKVELRPLVEKRQAAQVKEEEARKEWKQVLERYEALMQQTKKAKKE